MPSYAIVPATAEHAAELARVMRDQDKLECLAFGFGPREGILHSMSVARDAWTGLADGRVICMWGSTPPTTLSDQAEPWLLTAHEMPKHAKTFLKMNRAYVEWLKGQYSYLSGWVHERNRVSQNWLRWLGFAVTLEGAMVGEHMFYKFTMDCRK